jgi:magnesium transporter
VDRYFQITELVDERLDDIEEIVFGEQGRDEIPQEVFQLRRGLVRFRRAAAPLREVIGEILRREVDCVCGESLVHFQDVYDHSLRIYDLVESQRDLLTGLLEAHLAVVSNRMNQVMKLTSSWGAIILGATLIAGIYGMNFRYMPELDWHYGYFFALGAMAVLTVVLYRMFRKRGWL